MGCAMAGELARRGCHVVMFDETEFTRTRAKNLLQAAIMVHVQEGLMLMDEAEAIMNRIQVAETLEEAAAHAALVFEAVVDDLNLKVALFRRMVIAQTPFGPA